MGIEAALYPLARITDVSAVDEAGLTLVGHDQPYLGRCLEVVAVLGNLVELVHAPTFQAPRDLRGSVIVLEA